MQTLKDITRIVKEQADIVAVVGRTVALKKAGNSYRGLCPFHNEKTPSFHVVPSKGIYHCFGCKAGGSVIDFLMNTERLTFIEALKKLADEMGMALPEADASPAERELRDEQEKRLRALQSANDFALEWFRANLLKTRNRDANTVMETRGITSDLGEKFMVGAALNDWTALLDAGRAKGFSDGLMIEAGLAVRNEESGRVYDRFRHRLIFPILDHLGRPIGFGGRRLDDDPKSPKYLNSAETPLYKKGKSLYALNVAQKDIGDAGFAILTEGYMDTIMAHAFGFGQAVASLGTALTPDQARLLKRYASQVIFLYDGDDAGRHAMLRGGEALLGAGLDTRVILLPAADDPDTFLRREGADALRERLHTADEYFDFALDEHAAGVELGTISGQAALVDALGPLLNTMKNDVQREAAISRMMHRLGDLPREAIYRVLRQQASQGRREFAPSPEATGSSVPASSSARVLPAPEFDPLEKFALKLMIESKEALAVLRAELHEEWLTDMRLDPWILFFFSGHEDAATMLAEAEAVGDLPGDPMILPAILADPHPLGIPEHSAHQLAARIKRRHQKRVTQQLVREIEQATAHAPDEVPSQKLTLMHQESQLAVRAKLPNAPMDIQ